MFSQWSFSTIFREWKIKFGKNFERQRQREWKKVTLKTCLKLCIYTSREAPWENRKHIFRKLIKLVFSSFIFSCSHQEPFTQVEMTNFLCATLLTFTHHESTRCHFFSHALHWSHVKKVLSFACDGKWLSIFVICCVFHIQTNIAKWWCSTLEWSTHN